MKLYTDNSTPVIAMVRRSRPCRFWFNTFGELCGIWRTRTGRTAAIGNYADGKVHFYFGGPSNANWSAYEIAQTRTRNDE